MEIIRNTDKLKLQNTIVTLGKFDGFHIGHQMLIETAAAQRKDGRKLVIFTFDINPMLLSGAISSTIESREEREEFSYPSQADYVIEFPFTKETMAMEPETFVKEILVGKLGVQVIVAGYDFRFGKGRAGDVGMLQELGTRYGFTVQVMEKVMVNLAGYEEAQEVSSTLIKKEIVKGNMENVRTMLGRPFCITGSVEHGNHLGTGMGFPTANLRVPGDKIMPPDGVYATRICFPLECGGSRKMLQECITDSCTYSGITNVGYRPTFEDGRHRTVETNIFDFDRDIYDREVTVFFYHFIRPERRFDSPKDLVKAIEADKNSVREYFEHEDTR